MLQSFLCFPSSRQEARGGTLKEEVRSEAGSVYAGHQLRLGCGSHQLGSKPGVCGFHNPEKVSSFLTL